MGSQSRQRIELKRSRSGALYNNYLVASQAIVQAVESSASRQHEMGKCLKINNENPNGRGLS